MRRSRVVAAAGAVLVLVASGAAVGSAVTKAATPSTNCTIGSETTTRTTTGYTVEGKIKCLVTVPSGGSTSTPTPTPTSTPSPTSTPKPSVTPTASPTSTPDPTTGGPCLSKALVVGCGFPDASSTGHRGDLKAVPGDVREGPGWHYDSRGWVEIDGNGATFSGYSVSVNVDVSADDVTVSNNRIVGTDSWGISLRHADRVTISRNTIGGLDQGSQRMDNGIRDIYGDSTDLTITGNDISKVASGINHIDTGGLIADNYIHDMGLTGSDHVNGIQSEAGSADLLTIRHNTILNKHGQTDAVMLAANDSGSVGRNKLVTGNLLAGGGYTVYAADGPGTTTSNIKITDNRFSRVFYPQSGAFGPLAYYTPGNGNAFTGNVWDDTGTSVSP